MRKTVIVFAMAFVLLSAGAAFADMGNFGGALKVGVDFAGRWGADTFPSDFDTNEGVSITAEGFYKFTPYVDGGVGVQYMFPREIDGSPGWKFWFLPVYGVFRAHPEISNFTPYGIVQIGYAFHGGNDVYFNGGDTNGNFYWGGGAGMIIKRRFIVEVLYSESRGTGEIAPGVDLDVEYRRVTASVGVNF